MWLQRESKELTILKSYGRLEDEEIREQSFDNGETLVRIKEKMNSKEIWTIVGVSLVVAVIASIVTVMIMQASNPNLSPQSGVSVYYTKSADGTKTGSFTVVSKNKNPMKPNRPHK